MLVSLAVSLSSSCWLLSPGTHVVPVNLDKRSGMLFWAVEKLRSCVKVEVAILGSPFLIVCMVSVDIKQHWTEQNCWWVGQFISATTVEVSWCWSRTNFTARVAGSSQSCWRLSGCSDINNGTLSTCLTALGALQWKTRSIIIGCI